jgi:hypothetical protein
MKAQWQRRRCGLRQPRAWHKEVEEREPGERGGRSGGRDGMETGRRRRPPAGISVEVCEGRGR